MNNKEAGEQLAATIHDLLKARRRSLNWLADEIGMKYPTLRRQLKESPEKLGLFTVLAIETALELPAGDLLFQQVAA